IGSAWPHWLHNNWSRSPPVLRGWCPSGEGTTVHRARLARKEGVRLRRGLAVVAGAVLLLSVAATARASNPNGSGGDMPAFYDGQLFTINFKLLKPDLHKNPSFNTIYQCDACEAQGLTFVSVLDA